ncbi:hypothetical protein FGG08_006374 [Glutinoglossum americanum]|uniref:Uncharacterized protein n=1 Tax=Glutinoglossum americanum TaxID=1670608 RepID=A0A9P8I7H0_9PEZI|nr:hypothetical protein FGG08_006374 [Glutinoglossum americanum]
MFGTGAEVGCTSCSFLIDGWSFPWYLSLDNSLDYDFHVALDKVAAPVEYNFKDKEMLGKECIDRNLKGKRGRASEFIRVSLILHRLGARMEDRRLLGSRTTGSTPTIELDEDGQSRKEV